MLPSWPRSHCCSPSPRLALMTPSNISISTRAGRCASRSRSGTPRYLVGRSPTKHRLSVFFKASFYLVFAQLGVPMSVAQHLSMETVLFAAGAGVCLPARKPRSSRPRRNGARTGSLPSPEWSPSAPRPRSSWPAGPRRRRKIPARTSPRNFFPHREIGTLGFVNVDASTHLPKEFR